MKKTWKLTKDTERHRGAPRVSNINNSRAAASLRAINSGVDSARGLPSRPVLGGGSSLLLSKSPAEWSRIGPRGKLCFCTTTSSNAFWGSLLFVIDRWLKLVGNHIFSFLGTSVNFGRRQILPVVSCCNIFSTRDQWIYSHEDVTRPQIPRKEKIIGTRRSFLVQLI